MYDLITEQSAPNIALPENPEPGDVFTSPDGEPLGTSTTVFIQLADTDKKIAMTEGVSRVQNLSKVYTLSRTISAEQLNEGDRLHVIASQREIKSLVFAEYFAWVGKEYFDKTDILMDKTFKIIYLSPLMVAHGSLYVYEYVGLEKEKGDDQ